MGKRSDACQVTAILTPDQFAWFEASRKKQGLNRAEFIRKLTQDAITVDKALALLPSPEQLVKLIMDV